ncbi:hypothetical protein [Clostridium ihumii]|uniref:hypothetical protein n=1 Tax=Clostridium ihumii TaxID=1470356 RepID=UPI0005570505|nr:hypothetical protein [Clostridium ihumii]
MRKNFLKAIIICFIGGSLLVGCGNNNVKQNKNGESNNIKSEQSENIEKSDNKITLKFGELVNTTINNDTVVIKTKIKPSMNNRSTIQQNGFNIEDLVLNQGMDAYNEIQYWAVADMEDGSEAKVVSFTIDKALIESIKSKSVVGNQIISQAKDLWVLPSLKN